MMEEVEEGMKEEVEEKVEEVEEMVEEVEEGIKEEVDEVEVVKVEEVEMMVGGGDMVEVEEWRPGRRCEHSNSQWKGSKPSMR